MSGPLSGLCVLVTRPPGQAGKLSAALARVGAVPVEMPVVEIEPPADWGPVDAAVSGGGYHWVVFTSANAVDHFWQRLAASGQTADWFRSTRVAAVGPETERSLKARDIRVDVVPDEFVADALTAIMADFEPLEGRRVLLPAADIARESLAKSLSQEGALVERVTVYRTVPARVSPEIRELLGRGAISVVTFTSASTVNGLLDALGGDVGMLDYVRTACIGPVTAQAAESRGLRVDVVAKVYTIPGLVDAICELCASGGKPTANGEVNGEA